MTKEQIERMVKDACEVENLKRHDGEPFFSQFQGAIVLDLCCHIKALASYVEELEGEVVHRMKANAELAYQISKGLPTFIVAAPDPQETTPEEWQAAMDSLKKEGMRQLPDYDTGYLRQQVNYWAYCTWRGMLRECPEKRDELTEFFTRLKLMPYANRALLAKVPDDPR